MKHFVGETKKRKIIPQSISVFTLRRPVSQAMFVAFVSSLLEIVFQWLLFKFCTLFFHPMVLRQTLNVSCLLLIPSTGCTVAVSRIYSCKIWYPLGRGEKLNGE